MNLKDAFLGLGNYFSPRIIGEVNDQYKVKLYFTKIPSGTRIWIKLIFRYVCSLSDKLERKTPEIQAFFVKYPLPDQI